MLLLLIKLPFYGAWIERNYNHAKVIWTALQELRSILLVISLALPLLMRHRGFRMSLPVFNFSCKKDIVVVSMELHFNAMEHWQRHVEWMLWLMFGIYVVEVVSLH